MFAVPSNDTPPIVLAFASAVAVAALPVHDPDEPLVLPVTLPVKFPTTPPVIVATPVTDRFSTMFTEFIFTTSPNDFHATISISSPTVAPDVRVTVVEFVSA